METVITGVGMISALGQGADASCAAIRAGLSRPRPLAGPAALDLDAGEPKAPTGHPVDGVTDGFAGLGLWKRLGERALADLARRWADPREGAGWEAAGLIVALPVLDAARFLLEDPVDPEALRVDVGVGLVELLGLPVAPAEVAVTCGGHAAAIAALEAAQARIASGALERCVILGVDSYVDDASLAWLAADQRLKSDDVPTGLAPGEAGACLLLESPAAARRARRAPLATVRAVRTGRSREPWTENPGRNGLELARVLDGALPAGAPFSGDLVLDLNGETWRARELGAALTRVSRRLGPGVRWLTPAASLGDTGAASAAVAICLAVSSWRRGWARGDEAIVVATSEDGGLGAARLAAPPPPGKG